MHKEALTILELEDKTITEEVINRQYKKIKRLYKLNFIRSTDQRFIKLQNAKTELLEDISSIKNRSATDIINDTDGDCKSKVSNIEYNNDDSRKFNKKLRIRSGILIPFICIIIVAIICISVIMPPKQAVENSYQKTIELINNDYDPSTSSRIEYTLKYEIPNDYKDILKYNDLYYNKKCKYLLNDFSLDNIESINSNISQIINKDLQAELVAALNNKIDNYYFEAASNLLNDFSFDNIESINSYILRIINEDLKTELLTALNYKQSEDYISQVLLDIQQYTKSFNGDFSIIEKKLDAISPDNPERQLLEEKIFNIKNHCYLIEKAAKTLSDTNSDSARLSYISLYNYSNIDPNWNFETYLQTIPIMALFYGINWQDNDNNYSIYWRDNENNHTLYSTFKNDKTSQKDYYYFYESTNATITLGYKCQQDENDKFYAYKIIDLHYTDTSFVCKLYCYADGITYDLHCTEE